MTSSSCRKCWGPFGSHYKVTRAVCCIYHVARGYCEPSIAAACAGRVRRGFDALPSAPPRCRLVRWVGLRRIRHAVARVALSASRAGRRNRAEAPLEYLQERCYRVDCDGGGDDDDVDDVDADDDDDVDLW